MKCVYIVIYFLVLLHSGVKSQNMEDVANLMTNCLKKYPVSDEEFVRQHAMDNDLSLASDSYKCFGMCVVQGRGWFIDDVLIDDAYIKAEGNGILAKRGDQLHNFAKECKLLVGANKCDTVFQVTNCMDDKIKELLRLLKLF
uniref:Odorant binding protein n=1 Tax=Stomoxys calcitrans TaxID=35570 RepID=A0A1I8P315_STOCA